MTGQDTQGRPQVSEAATEAYHARRDALHTAVVTLEHELVELAAQTPPDRDRLRAALELLLDTVREHIEGAEAADGLLAQIAETASWIAPRIAQLRTEHRELLSSTERLIARLEAGADVTEVLGQTRELAEDVTRHRHRATGVLLDAYLLDIPPVD